MTQTGQNPDKLLAYLFSWLISLSPNLTCPCLVCAIIHFIPLSDFNIYHEEISVIDPSGLQLSGLNSYKSSFKILQSVIGLFYNTDKSSIQYRMIYDFSRSSIRISFNVILIPKVVGNRRNALYVDGISVYKMSSQGKISEHRIENLMMNNIPVRPPYGVLTELLKPISSLQGSPVGVPAGGFGIGSTTM